MSSLTRYELVFIWKTLAFIFSIFIRNNYPRSSSNTLDLARVLYIAGYVYQHRRGHLRGVRQPSNTGLLRHHHHVHL